MLAGRGPAVATRPYRPRGICSIRGYATSHGLHESVEFYFHYENKTPLIHAGP
jgi:hypothetical protein